jgi:hypothetical protein
MKRNHNRIVSLIITVLLTTMTFSCANSSNSPTNNTADTSAQLSNEVTTAKTINWESANLPKKDFGGKEFVILTRDTSNKAHTWYLVAPDELNGDTLNDTMYNRNKKIEEIYNISISSYYSSQVKTDASNAINAGDDTYSAVFGAINDTYPLAQEGKFYNFYDNEYINLEAPWWDQTVIRDLTYHDTLYTLTGDISPATNVRVYTMVFNKDMCADLNLELPYQYVLDGTWTLDRFNKYISDVNYDVNGDSNMDYNDRWGFFSQDGCSWMMYFAGGGQVVAKDQKGDLSVAYNTERNIQLATKALEIAFDKTKTLMANQYVKDNGNSWAAATSWFSSGGALFRSSVLEPIPRDLRSLDVNFGIVPFPKLDENQKQYYTLPEEYSIMFSVPVTADPEFSGLILESLAAESVSSVSPAFYDICLNGKAVRDEESKAMLDIIFSNKIFDIGYISNIATFRTMLLNLEKNASTDVASAYASSLEAAKTELEKICKNFDSIK